MYRLLFLFFFLSFSIPSSLGQALGKGVEDYLKKNYTTYFVIPYSENDTSLDELYADLIARYWKHGDYKLITAEEADNLPKKERFAKGSFKALYYTNASQTRINIFNLEFTRGRYQGILGVSTDKPINEISIVYALKVSQFLINNYYDFGKGLVLKKSSKKYGKYLTHKTLLLTEDEIAQGELEKIKSEYKYDIEIVSLEEKAERIFEESPNHLSIMYADYLYTNGTTASLKIIYSLDDGAIVSFSIPKATIGNSGASHLLDTRDFKRFLKNANL